MHVKQAKPKFRAALLCAGAAVFLRLAISPAQAAQELFPSPDRAAEALVAANQAPGTDKLLEVLGPSAKDIVSSGDAVADARGREKFVAAYQARHSWDTDSQGRRILVVGANKWPVPIPLVQEGAAWRFNSAAGREAVLARRIGHNELRVIATCRAYVNAQREYVAEVHAADGRHGYAQKFMSKPGRHDGLFWEPATGQAASPFGPLVAQAEDEGYIRKGEGETHGQREPFHGYYYRILKEQGAAAPGGNRNYLDHGLMTGGFALVAWPAKYGDSGIKTFVVNQDGIVYEKDLGPKTAALAAKIKSYDPAKGWRPPAG